MDLQSSDSAFERVIPLVTGNAFKTVNGAVFYALARLGTGRMPQRDGVDGGTCYLLESSTGIYAQLFVLHLDEHLASIRMHPLIPAQADAGQDADYLWRVREGAAAEFSQVFSLCWNAIADLLRTAAKAHGHAYAPPAPPPPAWDAIFSWQEIYHPEMTEKELAQRVGAGHSTVRTERSRRQYGKRTPRGRPK